MQSRIWETLKYENCIEYRNKTKLAYPKRCKRGRRQVLQNSRENILRRENMTLSKIIENAKYGKIPLCVWEAFFEPVIEQFGLISDGKEVLVERVFESAEAALKQASEFHTEIPFRHVWSVVEGEKGNEIAVNGLHIDKAMFYVVTKNPWSNNELEDGNHIEVDYSGVEEDVLSEDLDLVS